MYSNIFQMQQLGGTLLSLHSPRGCLRSAFSQNYYFTSFVVRLLSETATRARQCQII